MILRLICLPGSSCRRFGRRRFFDSFGFLNDVTLSRSQGQVILVGNLSRRLATLDQPKILNLVGDELTIIVIQGDLEEVTSGSRKCANLAAHFAMADGTVDNLINGQRGRRDRLKTCNNNKIADTSVRNNEISQEKIVDISK